MVKNIITEISEEDFRKLDLKVYKTEVEKYSDGSNRYTLVEKSLNEILDTEIRSCIVSGYEEDRKNLSIPVTIAIHEPENEEEYDNLAKQYPTLSHEDIIEKLKYSCCYLDKYMNSFTGPQTFQLGFGIEHLYSSRDYYYDKRDYWKVSKKETKVIYRIKLNSKWLDKFVLKHETVIVDWPFNTLPEGISPDYDKAVFVTYYELQENGMMSEVYHEGRFTYGRMESRLGVDANGERLRVKFKDNKELDLKVVKEN